MPHTYPYRAVAGSNPPRHSMSPPVHPPSNAHSQYLTPVQERRILAWRTGATPSPSSTSTATATSDLLPPSSSPPPSQSIVKSAPASLQQSRSGTSTSCCPTCHSSLPPPLSSSQRQRSYYSSPRAKSKSKSRRNRYEEITASDPTSSSQIITPPQTPKPQDRAGLPSAEQVQAWRQGSGRKEMWGQAPSVPLPDRPVAMPKAEADPFPRIAGARDPVSQNYWKRMFPPAPGMIAPHPPFAVPPVGAPPGMHQPAQALMPFRPVW